MLHLSSPRQRVAYMLEHFEITKFCSEPSCKIMGYFLVTLQRDWGLRGSSVNLHLPRGGSHQLNESSGKPTLTANIYIHSQYYFYVIKQVEVTSQRLRLPAQLYVKGLNPSLRWSSLAGDPLLFETVWECVFLILPILGHVYVNIGELT